MAGADHQPVGRRSGRGSGAGRRMSNLVVAALFLVGTYFGIASSQIGTALVHRWGEPAYLALYSLLSLVAIGRLGGRVARRPLRAVVERRARAAPPPAVRDADRPPDWSCAASAARPDCALGQLRPIRAPGEPDCILRDAAAAFMPGRRLRAGPPGGQRRRRANATSFFGAFAVLALAGNGADDLKRTQRAAPGWGVFLQGDLERAARCHPPAPAALRPARDRPRRAAAAPSASSCCCSGSHPTCSASARCPKPGPEAHLGEVGHGGDSGSGPTTIVVMGVSGSGKSTVAAPLVAGSAGSSPRPTTSTRRPTSRRCTPARRSPTTTAGPGCGPSAPSSTAPGRGGARGVSPARPQARAYRDILVGDAADVRLVYLKGEHDLIARRQAAATATSCRPA